MNIHYIADSIIPSRSAGSIHVMKMAQAFSMLGHDVTLHAIASEPSQKQSFHSLCEFYGVAPTFRLELHRFKQVSVIGRGYIYPRLIAATICDARDSPDLIYGRHRPALLRLAKLGKPIVFEAHAPPRNMLLKALESKLLFSVQTIALVVISEALKSIHEEIFPAFTKPIIVAHDGADNPFQKIFRPFESWKGRPDAPQVGYTGHLYSGRGIETIVGLSRIMPQLDFHVFGGTEDLVNSWRKKAKQNNLFFHGFLPNSEVQRAFLHLDIVLAPYQEKVAIAGNRGNTAGFMSPLKLFEYMSWGKPMVVSDLPVIREILQDRHNARLVSPADISSWRHAIDEIIQDKSFSSRLGLNARKSFEGRYSWTARAEHILSALALTC